MYDDISHQIANNDAFVFSVDRLLRHRVQAIGVNLNHHAVLENAFRQAEPHMVVYGKGTTNDRFGQGRT